MFHVGDHNKRRYRKVRNEHGIKMTSDSNLHLVSNVSLYFSVFLSDNREFQGSRPNTFLVWLKWDVQQTFDYNYKMFSKA